MLMLCISYISYRNCLIQINENTAFICFDKLWLSPSLSWIKSLADRRTHIRVYISDNIQIIDKPYARNKAEVIFKSNYNNSMHINGNINWNILTIYW